jgi:hypothetical protein
VDPGDSDWAAGTSADADIRKRAIWVMSALRHHQAVEPGLIFESLATDIGVGD